MQKKEVGKNRNTSLDIARTIGTLLVILAHVGAPKFINEIRCFDVILLVFISGYCISFNHYGKYLIKRFRRLVIPAWVLLTMLFCSTWIACLIVSKKQLYNASKILKSLFFLNGGIGFVWIVRIYIGIAVIAPLIVWVDKKVKSNAILVCSFFVFILINSAIARCYVFDNNSILYYIVEIMSYSSIALLGYRYRQMKLKYGSALKWYVGIMTLILLIAVVVIVLIMGFQPNENKYPPKELYLLYGLFVTAVFFCILDHIRTNKNLLLEKVVGRYSVLSYDIYLVHIYILSIVSMFEEIIKSTIDWKIKYPAVVVLSLFGAIIVDKIKDYLKMKLVRV